MNSRFHGNDKDGVVLHFGLCATLTRSLPSGPPVGVVFGPRFSGNGTVEINLSV